MQDHGGSSRSIPWSSSETLSVCQQNCNYISWRLSWEVEGDPRSVFSFPFVVKYFKQLHLLDYTCSEHGLDQLILEALPTAAID